jgi:hypothetical protein
MAADQQCPRFPDLAQAALDDLAKDRAVHGFDRTGKDVHRQQWSAAHRVDIAQGIGGGDLTKGKGVVDDRSEEIDGLDQGDLVIEPVNPGIIGRFRPDDQVRVARQINSTQYLAQVPWAKFGSSTRCLDRSCQLYHDIHLLLNRNVSQSAPLLPGNLRKNDGLKIFLLNLNAAYYKHFIPDCERKAQRLQILCAFIVYAFSSTRCAGTARPAIVHPLRPLKVPPCHSMLSPLSIPSSPTGPPTNAAFAGFSATRIRPSWRISGCTPCSTGDRKVREL